MGRADLLAALFYLFAFRAYVKGLEGGRGSVSYGWLCVMALCAGCSTLCKETGITVLASCAVYDLFYACDLEDAWEIVSLILKSENCICFDKLISIYSLEQTLRLSGSGPWQRDSSFWVLPSLSFWPLESTF